MLFPTVTAEGRAYEVVGEIDLFKSPLDISERILLSRSGTGTIQQYTGCVDSIFRFAALAVYSQMDPGPNPLLEPLQELLVSNSDLLHQPKLATGWAELIRSVLPPESEIYERVNADYVAWNFRNRAALLADYFGMTDILHARSTYYMFSKAGVTRTLPGEEEKVA